jgi:hypothetical protein
MAESKNSPAAAATAANPFETSKNAVILKTKVVPEMAYIYRGFNDLKNLILFVGSKPMINGDMSLQFRKVVVPENSVVMRNKYGEIVRVLTFEQAALLYDIAAQSDFRPEDENKVVAKEVKPRGKKA